jgi:Rieske Fe-S protein
MSETTRRAVLAGAVGAGAAVVVAACGGGGSDSGSNSGSNSGSDSQAQDTPTQDPPATGGASTSAESTAPAANRLTTTSEIPVGGGKIFDAQKVVVTQPAAGQFKAFSAICTHMGCTVGSVSGGLIKCPCHGSQYSIQDGSVKGGPAPKALPAKQVTVTGNQIIVA